MPPSTPLSILITIINAAICLDFISNKTQNPSLQIQLPDGLIQGRLKHTADTDMPYYSYEGIPYAKPPVGELRFEPPQPVEGWDGVLEANGDVPACFQIPPIGYEDEDCLYINVYVPKKVPEDEGAKAVMVWIYGGGFMFGKGSSVFYGPDYLLERDVIVVHFNYRMNVFGFLATEDMASPGNYGLKDQQAALRWVRANIHLFGGDPDRITIFGESAGAASVSYLQLSPRSHNLFHRAIAQSGSALCTWAFQANPLNIAKKVAAASGLYFGDTTSMIQHFKRLKATALRKAAITAILADTIKKEQSFTFAPVLEPEHEQALITQSNFEMFKKGEFVKVPFVVGFNSQESGVMEAAVEVVRPLLSILPDDILIPPSLNNWDRGIGKAIKEEYFGDGGKSRTEQYIEFFSDNAFVRPIIENARLYSLHAPTYMYRFSYEGYYLGKNAILMGEDHNIQGVYHAEELWYIFARKDLQHANATDKLTRERMIHLWTNFAKFGNPTPDDMWPQFKKDDYPYLNIGNNLTIEYNFKSKTMEFWRKLFAKYGRPPFNTY
ncbi:hypothetical protein Zmor_023175 [Zophobas morio]|uniref:Carboxylic ester hydrolase n=2 Tax=Zophobas morio TaxID=2755281 RepID=A0AA38HYS7_9CUCU|nr:hypothetical protein Zmor_023175 [Zophobas morio]